MLLKFLDEDTLNPLSILGYIFNLDFTNFTIEPKLSRMKQLVAAKYGLISREHGIIA